MDACKHEHTHTVCVMDALFGDNYLWVKGSRMSSRRADLIRSPEINTAQRLDRTAGTKRSLLLQIYK